MANVITTRGVRSPRDFEDSMCEHVEADRDKADTVYAEDDTFGPVGRHVVCRECFERDQKELSMETCEDCGQHVPNENMRQWKWYDYYAPQGDEPLYICMECWEKEKHQERMKKDRKEFEAEMDDDYDRYA